MPRRRSSTLAALVAAVAAMLAAVVLPGAPARAADPRAQAAVVAGSRAADDRFPWIVALSTGCGGSLVAPDRVLTAAHCVEELRVTEARTYVGARLRRAGSNAYDGRTVRVADVATHPRYREVGRGGAVNDVAVLRLAEPVTDVPLVRLASPAERSRFAGGRPAAIAGWGSTLASTQRASYPLALRRGGLRMLSDRSCGRFYSVFRPGSMICAQSRRAQGRPGTTPCFGDSGGPLVVDGDLQVGVVSFSISCGQPEDPAVYARVSGLRGFLDDPDPVFSPQPLGRPVVRGRAVARGVVTCDAPAFRNDVGRITYRWGVNGFLAATGRRFRLPARARGQRVQCRAVAANAGGRTPSPRSASRRIG